MPKFTRRNTREQAQKPAGRRLFREGIDARGFWGRRWKALYAEYAGLLGGEGQIDEGQHTAVRDLASTIVALEQMQEGQVQGNEIAIATYGTLSNNRRRLLRELGLSRDEEGGEATPAGAVEEEDGPLRWNFDLLDRDQLRYLSRLVADDRGKWRSPEPLNTRGHQVIIAALRRIATGYARAIDRAVAQHIYDYRKIWDGSFYEPEPESEPELEAISAQPDTREALLKPAERLALPAPKGGPVEPLKSKPEPSADTARDEFPRSPPIPAPIVHPEVARVFGTSRGLSDRQRGGASVFTGPHFGNWARDG